ncbi:MAG: succinate dehydrogenase assembly factor 2, partial [Pseudomonadota bacterium]|nr:succinate dehydrogenase assembly factor 2 [Pseudomonadota bacterium]
MRELDELLIKYFDCHYQQSSVREQKAFRDLLEYNDPKLVELLLTSHVSELKPINNIIKKIKHK